MAILSNSNFSSSPCPHKQTGGFEMQLSWISAPFGYTTTKFHFKRVSDMQHAETNNIKHMQMGPGQLSRYSDSLRAGRYRSQWGARFSAPLEIGPGAPPSLLNSGYRVSFPAVKRPGRGVEHPPHLAPRLKKEQSYTSTLPLGLRGLLQGELHLYLQYIQTFCCNSYRKHGTRQAEKQTKEDLRKQLVQNP